LINVIVKTTHPDRVSFAGVSTNNVFTLSSVSLPPDEHNGVVHAVDVDMSINMSTTASDIDQTLDSMDTTCAPMAESVLASNGWKHSMSGDDDDLDDVEGDDIDEVDEDSIVEPSSGNKVCSLCGGDPFHDAQSALAHMQTHHMRTHGALCTLCQRRPARATPDVDPALVHAVVDAVLAAMAGKTTP